MAPDPERARQDVRIVERIGAGDESALAELYDRYAKPAYSLARRICVDEVLAEDVVQEVFLSVWREPGSYVPGRGAFASWLLTVVHHKAVDAVRREGVHRRRQVVMDDEVPEPTGLADPGADHSAIDNVLGDDVRRAIGALPPDQARAMLLAYYGGYTQREVASIVGVPLGTVKSRMFAASQRLRGVLAPMALDFGIGGARVEGQGL
ncbi:RNA polymerase sigma factor [Rhodococcus sp. X156]|uniref:RNA polymerase sigma factor n=1 Tax=Rhodococcus sp. X156 TaxID=2499145 RepID=UPI0019D19A4A|nr:RNA polymerase sigma factor [Rhodococcus sp. X156]